MKALIVGAGIAGLTLAWHLERDGWDVEIIERAPAFRDGGYLIDFFGAGYTVAGKMGLMPRLRQVRNPFTALVHLDRGGRQTSRFDLPSSFDDVVSVLRGDLARIIQDEVRAPVRYGTSVADIRQDDGGVTARLTDGTRRDVDLLVGADGIHSTVREQVFGAGQRFVRYLGHHVAAFLVTDDELSRRVGNQYQLLNVPGLMVGTYAIRGGRVAALILRREPDPALPEDPVESLRLRCSALGWVVPELLRRCPPDLYYDQVNQIEMHGWSRGRVVLLGDACQAVSLFAGHGASLAVAAASVLAEELRGDFSGALARYEQRMRPAIVDTQRLGRRTIEWMAPSSSWRITARDWVVRAVSLPPLNRLTLRALTPGSKSLVGGR